MSNDTIYLSCMFKSFGTIVSSFERSETSPVFLALLCTYQCYAPPPPTGDRVSGKCGLERTRTRRHQYYDTEMVVTMAVC